MRFVFFTACFCFIFILTSPCIAENFPYREKYPEVNILELTDLKSGYDSGDFLIIDVRSKTEFEAIHIKESLNLPYADARFIQKLRSITRKKLNKKIAVYDNGIDCIKSYKAAEDALYRTIPNVYAFDAGIASWAIKYPSETIFQGNELKKPSVQLISQEQFSNRKLDFETFKKKAQGSSAVIIDVRDPIQRKQELPGIDKDLHIPIDKMVNNIIRKGRMKDKQLLIFDQVGRQVSWLMYYLVENGYTDFYFLDGGATSVFKKQEYRVASNN